MAVTLGGLCGLKWEDVDLPARRLSVKRTLIKAGAEPILGPLAVSPPHQKKV